MSVYNILFCFFWVGVLMVTLGDMVSISSYVEWYFFNFKMNFYFNSLSFALILFFVTVSVLVFSSYYMSGEINIFYFLFVLMIFVGSMFFLNFSYSVLAMLVSWDILGISSFFLVLFYNNWDSCSGAMNTVLTNRVGDYFLFLFFGMVMFCTLSFFIVEYFFVVGVFLLVAAGFTKSAQFPFSGWLPKAMSAPTPVSSLVHSSTLVTAGLILIMNFSMMLFSSMGLLMILALGLLTMFFSSIAALVEEDMKKVVALSTLSQMGFAALTIGLSLNFISLVHLLSHALFKSCLFMQIGFFIHSSFSQQDGREYSNLNQTPFFILLQMLVTLFCLCGLIFSSGAVSKDYILELFFGGFWGVMIVMMFFCTVFLTFGYSYRLWKSLYMNFSKVVFHNNGSILVGGLSSVLIFFSVVFLWWLSENIFFVPVIFLYVDFFSPLVYIFILLFLGFICLKFMSGEMKYKFLADYDAKHSVFFISNGKSVDVFLEQMNIKGFSIFSFGGGLMNMMFKSLNFNMIMILVIFIFLFS
uniref:NADH:ubiquinone reductase (H(+)-translocating) n=1 Tax=Hammerschmidtiella sp. ZengetLiu-2016 TaxID=2025463 RepID=A0A3Q8B904_9BILA|nr:NADH dehydrogenase subunit 5 [Hammerschmidtiella sp. ZengetLiu-2016]